jgi:hypothetical protein
MKRLSGGRSARLTFAAAVVLVGLALTPARADVVVQIDKSSQRMAVSVDGAMRFACRGAVRTGRTRWAAQYADQIFSQARRRFNGSITLSIIDEISCADRETRAFIVQSRRRWDIRRRS